MSTPAFEKRPGSASSGRLHQPGPFPHIKCEAIFSSTHEVSLIVVFGVRYVASYDSVVGYVLARTQFVLIILKP